MKLSLTAFLLTATVPVSHAYLANTPPRFAIRGVALSSSASAEAKFSAFADSLEEEPEEVLETSWQAKLEDFLDPKTNLAERQILLSELMSSNDEIRESVMDALAKRKIDPLLTPTGKKLQDGTRAVVRQIANDILPQLGKAPETFPPSPQSLGKVGNQLFSVVSNQIQKNIEDLQDDLSDPINKIPQRLQRQTEDLAQEVKNAFLETPEGLQAPSYTVVKCMDLYEVRDYEGYTVASTTMAKGEDIATAGTAFNTLASYLFGSNEDSKSMAMTTPVTTTNLGEMRFYLAENNIPSPNSEAPIEIIDVPAARLAVRKFPGFVTDGEVARQKDTLLQALDMDGVELDVAHGAVVPHVVYQYNPPYTLPIVRRNEIAVPVKRLEDLESVTSLKQEWSVDEADGSDDGLTSWASSETESFGQDDLAPSD